jgi:arginine decarboxylase
VEIWHDTEQLMQELQQAFSQGQLALAERATAEAVFFAVSRRLQQALQGAHSRHNAVREKINEKLADKYFVNFSLFQSMPDVWAIEQIFPILPLQRLDEKPTRRGVLEDITCDSDGRIDHYVDSAGVESTLPLHAIEPGETYLLGIFLLGAYQEILGDMHNLFGDTDSIHVRLQADGSYRFSQALQGDTVDSILRYVHFNPDELLEQYQAKLQASGLDAARRKLIRDALSAGLRGYTYLEKGRGTRD